MVKRLLFFTLALFFIQISEVFSQITIGTIDAGPYTPGSSIAATFNLGPDCIKPGNKFNLYLVAPGGAETQIGSYDSFYSAFVNGTIPMGTTPGAGYVLRVKSTDPVLVSNDSNPFEIKAGPEVTAKVTSPSVNSAYPEVFGYCTNRVNQAFFITNESTPGGTVTAKITNELNAAIVTTLNFDAPFKTFTPGAAHYTMLVRVEMPDQTIATKAFLIINNVVNTAFSTSGSGVVCLPEGELIYGVDVSSPNGIQNNFPGNLYKIVWGDGTEDFYTLCELLKNPDIIHNYTKSSCGSTFDGKPNVFGINVSIQSPFCNKIGRELSTYAKVVTVTENKFSGPPIACVKTNVTFTNTSVQGQNQEDNATECTDNNVKYNWYIDGNIVLPNASHSTPFIYNFPIAGEYEIMLESVSNGTCQGKIFTKKICIQDPPKPDFNFPGNLTAHCAPFTITANDNSFVDDRCGTIHTYNWIVRKSGRPAFSTEVTFTNGIKTPTFQFLKQGSYEVSLQISSPPCGVVSTTPPQTVVIIDSKPITTLEPLATLCGLGTFTYNNEVTGPTNVLFSGTEVDAPDTYSWTVTASNGDALTNADYTFKDGINVTKYPSIEFKQYMTYKVSVTHKNSCESITTSQLITFKESPRPSIIANPICYNDQASIKGEISNTNYINYKWTTLPNGGTFLNDNTLEPIYIPSAADRTAGKATVILTVNTGIPGDCEFVSVSKEFIIYPNNTGINTTQTICTGLTASRMLTSSVEGSTFNWTAVNTIGNATGFSPSGSGNINEIITNASTTQNAVIVYTITPTANGCAGAPFTFTVTVTPKPVLSPVLDKTICEGSSVNITATSNIPTQFIWTSEASSSSVTGHTNPSDLSSSLGSVTIADVILNPTFQRQTVTYTITPHSPGGCTGEPIIVVVTIDPKVTQPNAGPDDSICATSPSNTYLLKGNEPKVGTGLWRLVSTHPVAPVIAVPGDFETNVSGLVAGLPYTFEWAITGSGACINPSPDQVTITITPLPVISAPVTEKTICHESAATVIINSDIQTQFSWTSVASPGITGNSGGTAPTPLSPLSNSITITDVLLNNTFSQGTVTYTIIPYSATGCPGEPIEIVVKVDPKVTTANAGTSTSICNTTTYDLKGSEPKVGTGLWEVVSASAGTPSIINPTDFETTVSGLEPGGVYVFKWTITGTGACQKSEAEVTITVNMPTIPGTTTTTQALVCQDDNTGSITLSGNTGSVLAWQTSPNGLDPWTDIPGTNNGLTYTFTNLTTTTHFRAVVQNAGCILGYSDPTTIIVAPATTLADAGPNQTLCNETSVSLKGNPIKSGETGLWSMVSGDANALITTATNNETTVTELNPNVTYVFRWTITGNSPCGPKYKDVTIRNNAPITQNSITASSVVCNGQQITINGSVPTGGEEGVYSYIWESKIDAGPWNLINNETSEDLTTTLNTTGTISFRRTVNSGTCTSTTTEFPITVRPPIGNNTITADQTICSGQTPALINGTQPTGGDELFSYQWQSSINGGPWTTIPGVAQNYQPPALTQTTSYRRIVSTLECSGNLGSTSDVVTITVTPNAKAEFTWGTTDQGCIPYVLPIQVVTYPDRNDTYTWYVDGVVRGTGSTFPGHTISTSGTFVTIKLVVTSSNGCASDEFSHTFSTNQAVPPSFDQSATEGCGPLSVNFSNTSNLTAGATFKWDFGNGQTSTAISPNGIIFDQDPTGKDTTYVVTLTSITSCGTNSVPSTVFVKAKPIAVFSPSKTEGCSPMLVNFTNHSPGGTNKYYYDFGDGSPIVEKTDKSPVSHIYNTLVTKTFTVTTTAVNDCNPPSIRTYNITVYPQNMTPELVVDASQKRGCAPFTVNFDNNSIGASRFYFDFGDGGERNTITTGTEQYTFTKPGTYTVKMTAYNSCSEMTEEETITVLEQPLPAFHAEVTLGCADLPVQFRNTTQGGITYEWDFGDGSPKSNEVEPLHIYKGDQEYYTVTLTATNALGCSDVVTRGQYIRVVPPPVAAFNVNPSTLINIPDYTFKFEDESTNNPTIWEWDFGDGVGTSSLKNPSYTYLDTGTYKVTLKVTNQNGCSTDTFKEVTIKGVPGYLFVPNSFIPGSEIPELRLFRAKGSGIKTWRFSVFNKWGQIIWETSLLDEGRPAEAWDGTFKGQPMPQGVYYWKIDVEMVNGTEWKGMTYDKTPPKRTGAIHLIR